MIAFCFTVVTQEQVGNNNLPLEMPRHWTVPFSLTQLGYMSFTTNIAEFLYTDKNPDLRKVYNERQILRITDRRRSAFLKKQN